MNSPLKNIKNEKTFKIIIFCANHYVDGRVPEGKRRKG
ncbi:hypothetical protein CG08_2087 [Riemerella anatipestifer]|uniref:Uncharacterized protein n=1 Tax=Riemerella anatipestifer (strain ATCC 11845 / DSM 15868 / JCM 9532 / NCTC 11014) TaxID=693978 RepID=H8MB23_RIEAD|nr:hypothetical protein RA0C_0044 [Riemerella anatipestifer ATCC 11845 = DSM 15868]AGC41015.1 hypothetical protein G148_1711 [Riemerella anatipestifer RA-CH-2]AKP70162.1 hypothetical protein CG08_2087 [Riemerella anatipestifer]